MKKNVSYYDVLEIPPTASDEDIKKAYRSLAKMHHPDRNPKNENAAGQHLRLLNEAYSKLKKPGLRARYDKHLKQRTWQAHLHQMPSDNDNLSEKEIRPFPWEDLARVGWMNMMKTLNRPSIAPKGENPRNSL